MKARSLSVLAGVSAPLILTTAADAGFVGIKVTQKPNIFNLSVCNVYAIFNRPLQDALVAVAGTPSNPMNVSVIGGTFYQNPFGGNTAPNAALFPHFPSLAFDSFVTIGKKVNINNNDATTLTPNFGNTPGSTWNSTFLGGTNIGWAVVPGTPQGNPFDPINSFPGNGQILIGQFATFSDAIAIQGMFLLQFTSNNMPGQQAYVSFFHDFFLIPGPGALALLGIAGLLGATRRRST